MNKKLAYQILSAPAKAAPEDVRNLADAYIQQYNYVEELNRAIKNGGPLPDPAQMVMKRQRREWPALWAAIDHIREG
jgi:hypothetical protein